MTWYEYRSADRVSKIVISQWWPLDVREIVEVVVAVQNIVAEKSYAPP